VTGDAEAGSVGGGGPVSDLIRIAAGRTHASAAELPLPTRSPFHFEATVRVLQRRPSHPVEVFEKGRYLRVFRTAHGLALASVQNRGSIDAPDVRLSIDLGNPSAADRSTIEHCVRAALGLDVDPAPLSVAAERLPGLRPTALALRGLRPPRFVELFETFANVVPFQQLSLDAGAAILRRLVERFGERLVHDGATFFAFPSAHAVARARLPALLACGLSRAKAESLRRLARIVDSGEVKADAIASLGTNDALEALVALPGIGPWSAAVILLRGFGRLDVFPPRDSGARRGLIELLRLPTPAALEHAVERFGDCRGYLYFCGLGRRLLAERLIQPAPPVA
jgi:DNA-3-methyladenine glycosylase II